MFFDRSQTRRGFLCSAACVGAGFLFAGCSGSKEREESKKSVRASDAQISLTELLMRDHGIIARAVLIYETSAQMIDAHMTLPPDILPQTSDILKTVLEDSHETIEEEEIFVRLEQAGRLVDLVTALREQHRAGRRLTESIRLLSAEAGAKDLEKRRLLRNAVYRFGRMYRVHSAREDTVLFPAFHELAGPSLSEQLAGKVIQARIRAGGPAGFDSTVEKIAELEKRLEIGELTSFTPDCEPFADGASPGSSS